MTFPGNGDHRIPSGEGSVPPPPPASSFDGATTQAFTPLEPPAPAPAAPVAARRRHVWPWVVGALVVLVAAAVFGLVMFFQGRALPGTTLWGHDMTGKTAAQVTELVERHVDETEIPVEYDGKTAQVSAKDLGLSVDAEAIGTQVVDAKRADNILVRYLPWVKANVDPSIQVSADPTAIDKALGTDSTKPQDAALVLNEDGTGVEVQAAVLGTGADPTVSAEEAVAAVKGLGEYTPKTVTVQIKDIEPTVTDAVADQAKDTMDAVIAKGVTVAVADHDVASFDAADLLEAARIEPDTEATLADGESRDGVLVFDAAKLQDAYEQDIKPTLQSTKEDREVVVNANGEETEVIKEGHDGVKLADGSDANVGTQAVAVLADGGGTVKLDGTVDAMQVKKTKKHVVVDLSDHKVYAYENDKMIKAMSMSAGQGNDYETGACNASGDMCTPLGDFEIWLKYPSQDMSGTLTLSDGTEESWDVKDVGFVNYFSKSGCAIHRIATKTSVTDAQIAAMGANTSHGCVGIGWDAAEWFYDWCGMGTSVHVQQ